MAITTFELAVKYFRDWVFEGKQASFLASLRFCRNVQLEAKNSLLTTSRAGRQSS